MAGPSDNGLETWGNSSFGEATRECAWCHPGGGSMEYDRDGYRYDGRIGGYQADVGGDGVEFNPNRDTLYGDYYVFDPVAGVLVNMKGEDGNCDTTTNPFFPTCDTGPFVGKFCRDDSDCKDGWEFKGSAEVDCLTCHYGLQYNNFVRNYCLSEDGGNKGPQYGPAFGLVGTNHVVGYNSTGFPTFEPAYVATSFRGDQGSNYGNPSCDLVGYNWGGIIDGEYIAESPRKENCATCHKADMGWKDGVCRGNDNYCSNDYDCGDPFQVNYQGPCDPLLNQNPLLTKNTGPAGKPLGTTVFQKIIPPDPAATVCVTDSDCPNNDQSSPSFDPQNPQFCDTDTGRCNAVTYYLSKGRAEYGKRAESINDQNNLEHHMDHGFMCTDCHYLISSGRDQITNEYTAIDFPPVLDKQGRQILPGMSVYGIDHQFAKGNNLPDGKNMDQLDNTLSCEKCHLLYGTVEQHPNIVENGNCAVTGDECHMDGLNPCPNLGPPLYLSQPCVPNATYSLKLHLGPDMTPGTSDDYRQIPPTKHGAFPALHIARIDCRTCHIREQNFLKKETVSDYTSSPYPMDAKVELPRDQELDGGTFRCVGGTEEGERCNEVGYPSTCPGGSCQFVEYTCRGGGLDTADRDGDGNVSELIENRPCAGTQTKDPICQGSAPGACVKDGIHYRPLITWSCPDWPDCEPGEMELTPVTPMVNFIWKDLGTDLPYSQRFATEAVKIFRASQGGSGLASDPFTWPLNTPQNGDTALIINTTDEISGVASILSGTTGNLNPSLRISQPAINAYATTFITSHNRTFKGTLGEKGCIECHSSSDPANPNYSPLSVGFFDGEMTLFEQPADGGLQLACDGNDCSDGICDIGGTDTCIGGSQNGNPCTGNADCAAVKRVEAKIEFPCNYNAEPTVIDLTEGKAHGEPINNAVKRRDVLCYSNDFIDNFLTENQSASYSTNFRPRFYATQSDTVSLQVDFDASTSLCGYYECVDPTNPLGGDRNTCIGGSNAGGACASFYDCPGECTYAWDFTNDGINDDSFVADGRCDTIVTLTCFGGDRNGLPCVTDSECTGHNPAQTSYIYPDSTNYYRAKLTVTDIATGWTKSATKIILAKEIVPPQTPLVSGIGSTDGSGGASISIADNGYTIISTTIDWRDGSRQRVVGSGPHAHTYAVVGPTYSAKVKIIYSDAGITKSQYYIVPLATQ